MNDFERRDDRLDDQVQIEHLDPLDTLQERKIYRIFQILGFLGKTHRWGRRGILSGFLISFLILLCLLVFSNSLSLSSPQRNIPLLPSPLVSTPTPLEIVAATEQVVYVANKADNSLNALEAHTGVILWRFHYAASVKTPCLVVDALLYCTAFQEQVGMVYAIQIQHGNVLWWQPLPAGVYPFSLGR